MDQLKQIHSNFARAWVTYNEAAINYPIERMDRPTPIQQVGQQLATQVAEATVCDESKPTESPTCEKNIASYAKVCMSAPPVVSTKVTKTQSASEFTIKIIRSTAHLIDVTIVGPQLSPQQLQCKIQSFNQNTANCIWKFMRNHNGTLRPGPRHEPINNAIISVVVQVIIAKLPKCDAITLKSFESLPRLANLYAVNLHTLLNSDSNVGKSFAHDLFILLDTHFSNKNGH
jgi:hypothetical protein